jgi:hypothetical protein
MPIASEFAANKFPQGRAIEQRGLTISIDYSQPPAVRTHFIERSASTHGSVIQRLNDT